MIVSETEKTTLNILRKTKMEQNNEIKQPIFHSKYTVSWNCFAQWRKQKVSWRTSAYHGKQERQEMEAKAFTAFTANAAVQVFCQWHIKPWLPTQSSAAVNLSNTLSLGFFHISICFRDVHSNNGWVKIFVWQQQKCENEHQVLLPIN